RTAEAHAARLVSRGNWRQVIGSRGFLLLATEESQDFEPVILPNGMGLVAGALFGREAGDYERIIEPDPQMCRDWAETDGASLMQKCWGGYLAIVVDAARDRILIARDPMGARRCFVREDQGDGVRVVFTDYADIAQWSPTPRIDE